MRNKVVSSLAGAVFSFALSGLAFAADMPVKAPPPQPAPAYNWTGWYVGGNAGYSFGNVKNDFNAPDTLRAVVGFSVLELALALPISALLAPTRSTLTVSSVVVRSATTGRSLHYGSWGLRSTFRALTKKTAKRLPVTSAG
jgi:opacity protein-like surface antigen